MRSQSKFIYGLNNKDIAEKLMTRLFDRKLQKKDLCMKETLDYANHLEHVLKTTKKCNAKMEANGNVCQINNAQSSNEKSKQR